MPLAAVLCVFAHAQVDAQRALIDGGEWALLHDAMVGAPWSGGATVAVDVVRRPVRSVSPYGGPRLQEVTTRQLSASLVMGTVEVGLALPHHGKVVVGEQRLDNHWGDTSLWATVPLTRPTAQSPMVSVVGSVDLGNGQNSAWLGDPLSAQTGLSAQVPLPGGLVVAGHGAVRAHRAVPLRHGPWGPAWIGGVGLSARPFGPLRVAGELMARLPVQARDTSVQGRPIEALGSVGVVSSSWLTLSGGLGTGLNEGIGAPAWRALLWLDLRDRPRREREEEPPPELPEPAPSSSSWEVPEGRAAAVPQGRVSYEVRFATGSSSVDPGDRGVRGMAAWLHAHPDVRVVVEGSADGEGEADANQALSTRRAQAVVDALVGLGVARQRLVVRGLGEVDGGAEARRVRFVVDESTVP
jgi:outer membrane protein OmpA-like peptidoglycan-associated protein